MCFDGTDHLESLQIPNVDITIRQTTIEESLLHRNTQNTHVVSLQSLPFYEFRCLGVDLPELDITITSTRDQNLAVRAAQSLDQLHTIYETVMGILNNSCGIDFEESGALEGRGRVSGAGWSGCASSTGTFRVKETMISSRGVGRKSVSWGCI